VTLRAALRAGPEPLVAVLPAVVKVPHDLVERAHLRRVLQLKAEDVMVATGRRDCDPVHDEDVANAVFRWAPRLDSLLDKSSLGQRLRMADVRALVLAAELNSPLRLTQRSAEYWLAEWIVQGPPRPEHPGMLATALQQAHGRQGVALAWAVEHGVAALVTLGALGSSDKGRKLLSKEPPPPDVEPAELALLVDRAVRMADASARPRADAALHPAESLAHRARWSLQDAAAHPLLLGCLDQALVATGEALRRGVAPVDGDFVGLTSHRSADQRRDALQLARAAARVLRGTGQLHAPPPSAPWQRWFDHGLELGWLDLAIRELRLALLSQAGPLADAAQAVLTQAIAWRDQWNQAFAHTLARDWPAVTGANDAAAPLALHHLGRSLLAPLLAAGQKVYLAVLDGCDLATALELVRDLGNYGLIPVRLRAGTDAVGEAVRSRPALGQGISLVPTITSHARRALMLGAIPGSPALDPSDLQQCEDASRNASNDRIALQQNTALAPYARKLLLKPDLQGQAAALRQLFTVPGETQLVVAVWNGVDDALASHETTPLGPWKFADLGPGALDTLTLAVDSGWTVLLTADHGHTPYLSNDRKVLPTAAGGRFHLQPTAGSVAFDHGPLPLPAVHALADYGAWHGQQRKGYHGGAGFEEVAVPLFSIGKGPGAQALDPPEWWWGLAPQPLVQAALPGPMPAAPPAALAAIPQAPSAILDGLPAIADPRQRTAVQHLRTQKVLTAPQLARLLGIPLFMVQGMMATVLRQLTSDLGTAPFVTRDQDGELVYHWSGQSEP
jgi:hypothetical protein